MYEFIIYNPSTKEKDYIYGYNPFDAWNRRPDLKRKEWKIVVWWYID